MMNTHAEKNGEKLHCISTTPLAEASCLNGFIKMDGRCNLIDI